MEFFNVEMKDALVAASYTDYHSILCRGQMFKGSPCGWSDATPTKPTNNLKIQTVK